MLDLSTSASAADARRRRDRRRERRLRHGPRLGARRAGGARRRQQDHVIGNGGSAGIASHMANDFSKNGGLRALAFNDPSVLTCLGNDLGYEHVFAKQLEWHARAATC